MTLTRTNEPTGRQPKMGVHPPDLIAEGFIIEEEKNLFSMPHERVPLQAFGNDLVEQ